ncbi:Uncharacterised protein [Collinsella intestinalis]|nr:Uncharacterised protein [Collinsella intestinalis]
MMKRKLEWSMACAERTGSSSVSISMDVTRVASCTSASVNVPMPGPTSSTRSEPVSSANAIMRSMT